MFIIALGAGRRKRDPQHRAATVRHTLSRTFDGIAWVWTNYDPAMLRLIPFMLAPIVIIAGLAAGPEHTVLPQTVAADDPHRFVVVCNACGHREHLVRAPQRVFEQQDRTFRCPHCDKFAALAYRRGGLVVPPGGWSAGATP